MSEITPQAKLRAAWRAYCLPLDVVTVCREAADRIEELESIANDLLDIAECDANTPENAETIIRAQKALPVAGG